MHTITADTTIEQIATWLREDNFASIARLAADIKAAALRGCLLWTRSRIITTDRPNFLDTSPDH